MSQPAAFVLLRSLGCCALVLALGAAENLWPGGDFEPGPALELPASPKLQLVAEHGGHHLLISGFTGDAIRGIPLDPAWRWITVSLRLRCEEVGGGSENWHDARLFMQWQDAAGTHVEPWPEVIHASGSQPWRRHQRSYRIPEGARVLRCGPALFAPRGSARFDELRIVASSEAPSAAPASPLPLGAAANRALADAVADDGQGGWSDQGPGNDLSPLPAGPLQVEDLRFEIASGERAMLVLSGSGARGAPASARVAVEGRRCRSLFLLHALAWAPKQQRSVGSITVRYADGRSESITITSGIDVGDWWLPGTLPNARVAWGHADGQRSIGLQLSRFVLDDAPVESLDFSGTSEAVWGIVALAASPDVLALPEPKPFTLDLADDPAWVSIEAARDVVADSVLDLSAGLDAPAGKHGFVIARADGSFAFEQRPETALRFLGNNTGYANNFFDREQVDQLVERLARRGYNSLRLHHFDHVWQDLGGGGLPQKTGPTTVFDPERLDRLDYLVHRCKQAGIYLTLDLFTDRHLRPGELEGYDQGLGHGFKALVPIYEPAMRNWQDFARALMDHRNPYTGLRWADEPAIATISVINEDHPLAKWNDLDERGRALYHQGFAAWCAEQGLGELVGGAREHAWQRYVTEVQLRAYHQMARFLREELGCRQLLTDCNWHDWRALAPIRSQLDFVDNHAYWDHPDLRNGWRLPMGFHQASALSQAAKIPRQSAPTRILGKPFTITEFNFCYPNRQRAESGLLMGAYAALQDWSGLYRYALGDTLFAEDGDQLRPFSSSDPLLALNDLVIAAAFVEGAVAPARRSLVYALSPQSAFDEQPISWRNGTAPEAVSLAALTARVASVYGAGPLGIDADAVVSSDPAQAITSAGTLLVPEQLASAGYGADADGRYRADTGEIVLHPAAERLDVATARLLGSVGRGTRSVGALRIETAPEARAAIVALSRDSQPLERSRRILLLQLTDVQDHGLAFQDAAHKVVEAWGDGRLFARDQQARIALRSQQPLQVHAIDLSGQRRERIPAELVDGELRFEARVAREWGACLAYELSVD